MSEGKGTAVLVDFGRVGAGLGLPGEYDAGERLADLERVDVADSETRLGQDLAGRRDDAGEHHQRVVPHDSHGMDAGPGGQSEVLRGVGAGDEQRS